MIPSGGPELTSWIVARARELGFAAVGVARLERSSREQVIREWVAAGRHGPMEWFREQLEARLDPCTMLPGARSVIVVADRYADGRPDRVDDGAAPRGRTARYARGRDYHRRMKKRLLKLHKALDEAFPGQGFRRCGDLEPVLEREHAERAGVVRIGKHTLGIAPGLGSWILLGELLTTLELEPTRSAAGLGADPCGACTACIEACPTQAITPWSVDASRCISTFTLEERGDGSAWLADSVGDWLFGCDLCQEVCPHNAPTVRSREAGIHPDFDGRGASHDLLTVLGWTEADRTEAFLAGTLKRVSLGMARRNAVHVAAAAIRERRGSEVGRRALAKKLRELAADPAQPDIVRAAAQRQVTGLNA
ncbi:MAG: tRNA epoxyqueuosine(34) reductase QueG [Phycisphaerae bacterium]|nr:tRNA epoxyqueuosine(34) reductase QueG [Phycisphaerae bacterium]